ncbi:hypothetical protein LBMAG56_45490 [Verrucomicrobiota bacterium]|nr:hypothetical protein LBMAG56_45490 [Verrucomicrobiota bacterium]
MHDAPILDFALHHLTLGRAALFEAIQGNMEHGIRSAEWESVRCELDTAVLGLRRAGQQNFLPLGLLTRAWLRFLTGALTGPESAQADLDEAWEIAARGPMKLFLADIHLHRARLFGLAIADCRLPIEGAKYPWQSPAADLAAAAKLINACGYHRRNVELADAQRALLPRP